MSFFNHWWDKLREQGAAAADNLPRPIDLLRTPPLIALPPTPSNGQLFQGGSFWITRGAVLALRRHPSRLLHILPDITERHLTGDWGELCEPEQRAQNDRAVERGYGGIHSTYRTPEGQTVLISTALGGADGSTVISLPGE